MKTVHNTKPIKWNLGETEEKNEETNEKADFQRSDKPKSKTDLSWKLKQAFNDDEA